MVWALQRAINKLHGTRAYTTVQHLSGKQFAGTPIPLPPLKEQHRIVARVDELMQLCDDLEDRQDSRGRIRNQLRKSCLQDLTAANEPIDQECAWQRVVSAWEDIA